MNHPELKTSQDKTTVTKKLNQDDSAPEQEDSKTLGSAKEIVVALDFPRSWTFASNDQLEVAAQIIDTQLRIDRKTGIKMVRDLIAKHKRVEEAYSIQMAFNKVATEDEKYELFEWMTKNREMRLHDSCSYGSSFLDRFSLIHN